MSQSAATKLVSKLRYKIQDRRKLSSPEGPVGRHNKIRKIVTALFKHERIELNYNLADESRGYAERLISDAIRHGDCHKPTMEMATYWITESSIVHKLFKVLAPRYQNYEFSYTKLWPGPKVYPGINRMKCVLELQKNIYPPLGPDRSYNKNLIHNILLEEAKKEYRKEKAKEAEKASAENKESVISESDVIQGNKTNEVADNTVRATEKGSELPNEVNLEADKSENLGKSEVNAAELDIDLNKINIKEEKQSESCNEVEKK